MSAVRTGVFCIIFTRKSSGSMDIFGFYDIFPVVAQGQRRVLRDQFGRAVLFENQRQGKSVLLSYGHCRRDQDGKYDRSSGGDRRLQLNCIVGNGRKNRRGKTRTHTGGGEGEGKRKQKKKKPRNS